MNGYETEESRERHVKALLVELAQAQQAGDKDWEAAVRRSLADFGHKAQKPQARAERRPAPSREKRGPK